MSEILLSILTPSIPSRFEKARALSDRIESQIGDLPVEHLIFTDNKKRTIGDKRQALMQMANGRFAAYLDDDDFPHSRYVPEIVRAIQENPDVDVIVFNQHADLDGAKLTVLFGLEYENEQANIGEDGLYADVHRKPFHVCAWRTSLGKKHSFPSTGFDEDWQWVQKLLPEAKSQARIPMVLHTYRYRKELSEGDQTIAARAAAQKKETGE